MTESRRAFRDLLELLGRIDAQYVGETGEYKSALDVADGHRFVLHGLRRALGSQLESDTRRPVFQRAITPTTKFGGDSPDAIYHECNVSADLDYRIRGKMAGAVYVSLSVQSGGGEAEGVGASINSDQFEVSADGSYEILLSRTAPVDTRNWVQMPQGALNVLTRHYFEEAGNVMADAARRLDLEIAALDIAYAMAPFHVPPGKALVMSGRFPACRYAGLVLWSRFRQSFDYMNRRVSLNRAQTVTDGAGNYRIVLADRDPGVPNWLHTGGRTSGMMYWRFLLPEEPVPVPQCELVDIDALRT